MEAWLSTIYTRKRKPDRRNPDPRNLGPPPAHVLTDLTALSRAVDQTLALARLPTGPSHPLPRACAAAVAGAVHACAAHVQAVRPPARRNSLGELAEVARALAAFLASLRRDLARVEAGPIAEELARGGLRRHVFAEAAAMMQPHLDRLRKQADEAEASGRRGRRRSAGADPAPDPDPPALELVHLRCQMAVVAACVDVCHRCLQMYVLVFVPGTRGPDEE
ncbi:hypothetical protein P8C59_007710 [Phyllachora maydis]|uniref:Uncharacterized protein n=1 Tax=Phyllachora maydis TaxID=1825666 RepID=A0AAD9MFU3_9PEZI|nr:hypothetical protein P8C59_007710 [Phyllachora maydis]